MSTRMVILGFLRGSPLYGYEIKQRIEHVMGDWTDIAFGSIYFALKKLDEEGFIERVGTEQQAGRPSRTVYQITSAGREEFMRLLHGVWRNVQRQSFEFDLGLSFISALSEQEVTDSLRQRIAGLERVLAYIGTHEKEQRAEEHTPKRLVAAVFDHHRAHLQAELEWTRRLLEGYERGEFKADLDLLKSLENFST
ncbi:MAG: helix-turn-helix transcriptional regulator [Anaerolineales bacterium]